MLTFQIFLIVSNFLPGIISGPSRNFGYPGNGNNFNCPSDFPPGVRKLFIITPAPTYYPIGDIGAEERILEQLSGAKDGTNFSKFLTNGCPRRYLLSLSNTEIYYNETGLGDKHALKHCLTTHPTKAEWDCTPLNKNPDTTYHMSITQTDYKSYHVSVRCYPSLNLYSWIVTANVPVLPPNSIREIRDHISSLGFNWNNVKPFQYDLC